MRWYRDKFTAFRPSVSVNFRWNREAMTYVSYSQGFKGGGWNSHFNTVLTPEQQVAPAPAGVAPFITNAGKATIKGAEAEVTWAPTLDWTIEASGYAETAYARPREYFGTVTYSF